MQGLHPIKLPPESPLHTGELMEWLDYCHYYPQVSQQHDILLLP